MKYIKLYEGFITDFINNYKSIVDSSIFTMVEEYGFELLDEKELPDNFGIEDMLSMKYYLESEFESVIEITSDFIKELNRAKKKLNQSGLDLKIYFHLYNKSTQKYAVATNIDELEKLVSKGHQLDWATLETFELK